MKKIAILQSNYIPWKGYFDLINMVDEFIIYDTAQYTKNDWRNRNRIKSSNGLVWLTIPAKKINLEQSISDTHVADLNWSKKHWKTIAQNYSKAPYFKQYKDIFEEFYQSNEDLNLSSINRELIRIINGILGIKTVIRCSSEFELIDGQTERLMSICKQAGADSYLSGPAAKDYFDMSVADKWKIQVEWMDYSGYEVYCQLYPPFEHGVTILDLIFNEGPNSTNYMRSFSR